MGNFSRDTFDRLKHYVGVRLQQGVPLIDADWNEQEDIRKFELQTFLKWFAGSGVPSGNDGFRVLAAPGTTNNFDIKGGNGTALGAGRILVEGMDAMLESTMRYTSQPLYNNASLAARWGVAVIPPLTTPAGARVDLVYIDVWEREVDSIEDANLLNPAIGIESCVRLRREWAVRVAQGALALPAAPAGHAYYTLARLKRPAGGAAILTEHIEDLRTMGINLADLAAEIIDARGMKGSVGNRLDESLTKGGQLRFNVVGNDQVRAAAAINESKILFSATGHDHSGGAAGNIIGANGLEDSAVTRAKLDLPIVNSGSVVDLAPDSSAIQLVQANVSWVSLKRIYMPVIVITSVTGSGTANVSHDLLYRSTAGRDTFDVYIRIKNESGGSELVDLAWYVYIFGEE
ncbi:MAG: hypothetical protein HY885_16445 [Deltaproteobacteria bacterium]|nr:hypothetical protein [Deltaproteobacteria bacterium]